MAKFEPFWEVRVAVSLAGLATALPLAREKTEVASEPAQAENRESAVVAAEPARPQVRERAVKRASSVRRAIASSCRA